MLSIYLQERALGGGRLTSGGGDLIQRSPKTTRWRRVSESSQLTSEVVSLVIKEMKECK